MKKWEIKGVHRNRTFAEFHDNQIPGFLKEAWNISRQVAARSRDIDGSDILPPGR